MVLVKVYAVEKRIPEPVTGDGKRSERVCEGSSSKVPMIRNLVVTVLVHT